MTAGRPVVLIGAGGHAGVVADACDKAQLRVAGYLAPPTQAEGISGWSCLGDDSRLEDEAFVSGHSFIIALGDMDLRRRIGQCLERQKADLATVVHPSAILGRNVLLGPGSFVAAGAVINPGATIGRHAIINTRSSIDHDCLLGDYVQIAPGAVLGGGVTCGAASMIGIGAAVRQGIRIGSNVMVGAGAVVVKDLADGITAVGVPARPMKADK